MKPLACMHFKKTGSKNSKPQTTLARLRAVLTTTTTTTALGSRQRLQLLSPLALTVTVLSAFVVLLLTVTGNTSVTTTYNVPRVCSHQLLNAPADDHTAVVDGSLRALRAFWKAGVSCFDIDIVTLRDGTLLVTHPRRLAEATGMDRFHQHSLSAVRQAGADVTAFPILSDVLQEFATLQKTTRQLSTHDNLPLPLLNLDIKDSPVLTEDLMTQVVDSLSYWNILQHVAFCVTEGERLHSILVQENATSAEAARDLFPRAVGSGLARSRRGGLGYASRRSGH